jgi:hypothetical protein
MDGVRMLESAKTEHGDCCHMRLSLSYLLAMTILLFGDYQYKPDVSQGRRVC